MRKNPGSHWEYIAVFGLEDVKGAEEEQKTIVFK